MMDGYNLITQHIISEKDPHPSYMNSTQNTEIPAKLCKNTRNLLCCKNRFSAPFLSYGATSGSVMDRQHQRVEHVEQT